MECDLEFLDYGPLSLDQISLHPKEQTFSAQPASLSVRNPVRIGVSFQEARHRIREKKSKPVNNASYVISTLALAELRWRSFFAGPLVQAAKASRNLVFEGEKLAIRV